MQLRVAIACLMLVLLVAGCRHGDGESTSETTNTTPTNISQKESAGKGIPIFSFDRSGQNKIRAGDEDELFQEYQLWKEWVQYQRYNEWRREQELKSESEELKEQ